MKLLQAPISASSYKAHPLQTTTKATGSTRIIRVLPCNRIISKIVPKLSSFNDKQAKKAEEIYQLAFNQCSKGSSQLRTSGRMPSNAAVSLQIEPSENFVQILSVTETSLIIFVICSWMTSLEAALSTSSVGESSSKSLPKPSSS